MPDYLIRSCAKPDSSMPARALAGLAAPAMPAAAEVKSGCGDTVFLSLTPAVVSSCYSLYQALDGLTHRKTGDHCLFSSNPG